MSELLSVVVRFVIAALLLLAASFSGCALSADQGVKRPVLRAVYGEFYPYGFTGRDGTAQGYTIDVTRRLADIAGYDVTFISAENPRQFLEMLARDEADLTPFLALTPPRRAAGLATASLGAYVLSVYVRHDSDVYDIAALGEMRIGTVAGSVSQAAAEMLPNVELIEFQTADALVLPLLRGEVDAVVEVAETFEARLRISFIEEKVRRLKPPLAISPYGYIVRSDLPEVHAVLQALIQKQSTIEFVANVRAKWFGKARSIVEHPWFVSVAMIVGGIALTTFSLGVYALRLRRRSAVLTAEFGTNQLLVDAFNHMRAAIAIFDEDMRTVHWNGGFEAWFPEMLSTVRTGATLEQVCIDFHRTGIVADAKDGPEIAALSAHITRKLKGGQTEQRRVHTRDGNSFDVSMFPLGARYYAAVWFDMTKLHSQQALLAEQSGELVRKNQQLHAFSAIAAHDLKAPLVQQKVLMEFISEDLAEAQILLPSDAKGYFSTLSDLSCKMSLLVSDLLEYAKADFDQAETTCFAPNARMDGIVDMAALTSGMDVVIMPNIPVVQVDATCFDVVMRNLITNSAKHHDKSSGTITVSGFRDGPMVVIEVEDDGPGISRKDQFRIFEPFERLTRVEGTGLGLSFVKRTVNEWGGSVAVREAALGGAIFSIKLLAAPESVVSMKRPAAILSQQKAGGA